MIKFDVRSVSRLSSLNHNYVTFGESAANEGQMSIVYHTFLFVDIGCICVLKMANFVFVSHTITSTCDRF